MRKRNPGGSGRRLTALRMAEAVMFLASEARRAGMKEICVRLLSLNLELLGIGAAEKTSKRSSKTQTDIH